MLRKKGKLGLWLGLVLAAVVIAWYLRRLEQAANELGERSPARCVGRKTMVLQAERVDRPAHELRGGQPRSELAGDDLRRIEGIGPKISGLLHDAGISTFGQLAAAGGDRLRVILQQANIRLVDPTTWPEQATLAAKGEWELLADLQSELKGGRRV